MRSYAQVLSTDLGRLERIQADRSCEAARLPKLESSRFLVMCTARRTDSFRGRPGSMSRSAWCNKVVYPSWSACHMMFGVSRVSSYFGSSSSNIAVAQIAKTPKLPCGEWSLPRAGSTRLDGTRTELTKHGRGGDCHQQGLSPRPLSWLGVRSHSGLLQRLRVRQRGDDFVLATGPSTT